MRLRVVGCSGSLPGPDLRRPPATCWRPSTPTSTAAAPGGCCSTSAAAPSARCTATSSRPTVDAVALSHLHADHCLDLTGLYVALRYHPDGPRPERLPVHGPTGTAARLARAYDLDPDPGMGAEYAVHEWAAGTPVTIGPFTVTPHPAEHPVEAYALRVEGPAEDDPSRRVVLTYSGDTDACDGPADRGRRRRPAAGRGGLPGGPRHHPRHPPHRSPRGRGGPRRRRWPGWCSPTCRRGTTPRSSWPRRARSGTARWRWPSRTCSIEL